MENVMLFAEKNLHVGGHYMLGRIIRMRFSDTFDMVTVRYKEHDIKDKIFKVFKVERV
jgi:hypothetical protein